MFRPFESPELDGRKNMQAYGLITGPIQIHHEPFSEGSTAAMMNLLPQGTRRFWEAFRPWICALALLNLVGCVPKEEPKAPVEAGFEEITAEAFPEFADDADPDTLKKAIQQSLLFYSRIPPDRTFALGSLTLRADTLRETLELFSELASKDMLDQRTLAEHFHVYRSRAPSESGESLVTGYFEPILDARLRPDSEFTYPLYGPPPDLLTIDLNLFDPEKYPGARLVGRLDGNRVVPFYSRREIDQQGRIAAHRCEIAWIRDPIDGFFLHVQGSGKLRLGDGNHARIGYAGTNGHPYRSIGKYLIDQGVLTPEEVSLQSIRDHLRTHPEKRDEILFYNPSYIFFRWVEEGPVGSLNVVLTAGRSIATDLQVHPRGGLAFLETRQPRLDPSGRVIGWSPLRRWVLNQDTGGAIKGVGRVDLFCGSGDRAEGLAGNMKSQGRIYFFVKRTP